jgi:hypothetical protein
MKFSLEGNPAPSNLVCLMTAAKNDQAQAGRDRALNLSKIKEGRGKCFDATLRARETDLTWTIAYKSESYASA